MSSHKWACFGCRIAVKREVILRRNELEKPVKCPTCGQLCIHVGTRIPIPPKAKRNAWRALHQQLLQQQREYYLNREKHRVCTQHHLEREMVNLASAPRDPARKYAVKKLKATLDDIHFNNYWL